MFRLWAARLGVLGAAVSLISIALYRAAPESVLSLIVGYFNYLGIFFGHKLFASRGIAPPQSGVLLFEVFLVVFAGIQWFLIGAVIDLFQKQSRPLRQP